MEQGGWLDQTILWVLRLLTNTGLGVAVALLGGGVVAFLARISPRDDWEVLKEWPSAVLGVAFVVYSGLRMTPRLVLPEYRFSCRTGVDGSGLPTTQCGGTTSGTTHYVYDYTPLDMARDFLVSFLQEGALGLVGGGVGALVGVLVLRARRRRGQPG